MCSCPLVIVHPFFGQGALRVWSFCGALGVSRGGFYAWLTRPRSQRSRNDEELGAKVRASFLASDRTYGARRVCGTTCWRKTCRVGCIGSND
jgi:hypothetical protein